VRFERQDGNVTGWLGDALAPLAHAGTAPNCQDAIVSTGCPPDDRL